MTKTGSQKMSHAVHHWLGEKISAILLLLLSVWLIYFFNQVSQTGGGYDYVRLLLQQPLHGIACILFINIALYHGALGSQVVFEDYIHNLRYRAIAIFLSRTTSIALGVGSTASVINIMING